MANNYTKNAHGFKNSVNKYRNINGIQYEQWTHWAEDFPEEKRKAKELGLKYKVIAGELFREVKE